MKKTSTLILAFFMMIVALPTIAQSLLPQIRETTKSKSRKVYCLEMYYPGWGKSYGISTFKTDNPAEFSLVQDLYATNLGGGGDKGVFSGAAADDVYYTYFYSYSAVEGARPGTFATVNLRNGETKLIYDFKLDLSVPKFYDMTYDYSTKTMYGTAFVGAKYQLYRIDLTTGIMTPDVLIAEGSRISGIAASMDGQLYGLGGDGNLYKINKTTGATTKVMSTGLKNMFWESLEFDHTDETLYGAVHHSPTSDEDSKTVIIKFDLKKNTFETLGEISKTKVFGLYIPYLLSGFDAAGAPTDLQAIAGEKGAEKASISWKNPVKTYGDDALSTITSIKLLRDGTEIKSFPDVTPGQAMSWEDNTVKTGEHIYSIYATNAKGDGELGKIDCFVGKDIPAMVNDLKIHVNGGFDNTTITWTEPKKGARDGYFNAEGLTYTVVRYPDSLVVAKNINELSYTDKNIVRLALYYYSVTASNSTGQGTETYSTSLIMGAPLKVPYTTFFNNNAEVQNTWSGNDHNGDGCTWVFNLGLGMSIFGSDDQAAEYIAVDGGMDADDYLISPPFTLTKGVNYQLSFNTRSIGEDSLVISLLSVDTPRKDIKSLKVSGESPKKGKVAPWVTTTFNLPADIETGAYEIGIKVATVWGNSGYLQLTGFSLKDAADGIENENVQPEVRIYSGEGIINISGEFNRADIYNAAGWRMGQTDVMNPCINTNSWTTGIYFVKVTSGNSSKVYKVFIK